MKTYIGTARDRGPCYARLTSSMSFCICSTCEANISGVLLCSSNACLTSLSLTHNWSSTVDCKHEVEALLALVVLRDLGLNPQPRPFD